MPGPRIEPAEQAPAAAAIRIGYAHCSTAQQELQSQLSALAAAHCKRVISEKISTRVKVRPELEKALKLAYDIREAAPDQEVILAVHELKRLALPRARRSPASASDSRPGLTRTRRPPPRNRDRSQHQPLYLMLPKPGFRRPWIPGHDACPAQETAAARDSKGSSAHQLHQLPCPVRVTCSGRTPGPGRVAGNQHAWRTAGGAVMWRRSIGITSLRLLPAYGRSGRYETVAGAGPPVAVRMRSFFRPVCGGGYGPVQADLAAISWSASLHRRRTVRSSIATGAAGERAVQS
ncbi:recombinase family protein [Streptomyces klenkii]